MGLSLGWGAHLHITFANYFAKAELNISLFAGCGLNNSLLLSMKMVDPSIRQESPFITLLKQTPPPPMWFLHGMRRHVLFGGGITILVGVQCESSPFFLLSLPNSDTFHLGTPPSPPLPGQYEKSGQSEASLPSPIALVAFSVFKSWHYWAHWQKCLLVRFSKHL